MYKLMFSLKGVTFCWGNILQLTIKVYVWSYYWESMNIHTYTYMGQFKEDIKLKSLSCQIKNNMEAYPRRK